MKIYKVSELLEEISWILEDTYGSVVVEGEASEVKISQKGHLYFYLKDEKAVLRVVMWANLVYKLPFKVEEGIVFLVTGILKIYPPTGNFQLEARKIEPSGLGALKLAFEQRKKKLEEEGLFSPDKKKPLPFLPQKIGVITSPESAAIKDFLKILQECKVPISIIIYPSLMQGKKAADEILNGLEYFKKEDIDLLVITRGGGSFEDLMVFNEEFLVRAIYSFSKPSLSAVGHEVDVTLCDLVSDIRAATPTDAARIIKNQLDTVYEEMIEFEETLKKEIKLKIERQILKLNNFKTFFSIKNLKARIIEFSEKIKYFNLKMRESQIKLIRNKNLKLNSLRYSFSKRVFLFIYSYKNKLSFFESKLKNIRYFLAQKKEKIQELKNGLLHLNIKRTLKRGFSILWKDKKIIKDQAETNIGENIEAELYKGRILCQIVKKKES